MRGLPAGPSRLTSRFDMDEDGVDYAELTGSWLGPDTSGWISDFNRKKGGQKRCFFGRFWPFYLDFCSKMWYNAQFMDHCSWFIDYRHQIFHICRPQRGKVLGPAGPTAL